MHKAKTFCKYIFLFFLNFKFNLHLVLVLFLFQVNFREAEKEPIVIQINQLRANNFFNPATLFNDYKPSLFNDKPNLFNEKSSLYQNRPKFSHAATSLSLSQKNGLSKGLSRSRSRPLTKFNQIQQSTPLQYISMTFKTVLLTKTPRANSNALNSNLDDSSRSREKSLNMYDEGMMIYLCL